MLQDIFGHSCYSRPSAVVWLSDIFSACLLSSEWYRENMSVEISPLCVFKEDYDKRPEIQRNVGRKYYILTFRYKQKQPDYYFAFDVSIWEDDGEPEGIMFGNNFGLNFLFEPYNSLVKKKEKYQIPYDYELDRSLKMLYGE